MGSNNIPAKGILRIRLFQLNPPPPTVEYSVEGRSAGLTAALAALLKSQNFNALETTLNIYLKIKKKLRLLILEFRTRVSMALMKLFFDSR